MSEGWVCPECGLAYDPISKSDAAVAIRSFPRRIAEELHRSSGDDAVLRQRPEPTVWSALEYAAHVRDGFIWFADLLPAMVRETDPEIVDFDPDERAARERYNEQDVHAVLAGLESAANRLATVIDDIAIEDLDRTGRFSWGRRDVLIMIRNAVHEGKHHLRDIELVLDRVL